MTEWALRVDVCTCLNRSLSTNACVYLYEREKEDEAQSELFLALSLFTEGLNMA